MWTQDIGSSVGIVMLVVSLAVGLGIGLAIGWRLKSGAGAGGGRGAGGGSRASAGGGEQSDRVELYVGNLAYSVNSKDLRKAFEACGKVASARVIQNKFNGKSKGFGFVEMADQKGASAAIKKFNGQDFEGRKLVVNEAKSGVRD